MQQLIIIKVCLLKNNRNLVVIVLVLLPYFIFSQSSLKTTLLSSWKDSTNLSLGYNDVWGYADETGEYAIIGSKSHINFVNVTDPTSPYSILKYPGGTTTTWRDIKTYDHYAYSVCDNCSEGIHVFDLSKLPLTVSHVNQITSHFGNSHNIFIEDGRLYAVGMAGTVDLMVFDLKADPVNPPLLGSIDFDITLNTGIDQFYIHDVFVKNKIAYASHGYNGYYIWDVSDPTNVSLIADNNWGGYNHSSWISDNGKYAYVAEEIPKGSPMIVVDISTIATSGSISSTSTFIDNLGTVGTNLQNVTHHNPFVHNDMLFISNYEDGIKIYDIRDPQNPVLYGYYDSYPDDNTAGTYNGYNGVWGTYPFLPSGLLLASDRKYGLQVIDVDYFDCDNTVKIVGNETVSVNEKYSCCIISGLNSSISNQVDSKYTAQQYIEFSSEIEVSLGSQVLFDIEVCEN